MATRWGDQREAGVHAGAIRRTTVHAGAGEFRWGDPQGNTLESFAEGFAVRCTLCFAVLCSVSLEGFAVHWGDLRQDRAA